MTQNWPFGSLEQIARELEASETPRAAPRAILRSEILTPHVWDPTCGRGVCAEAAKEAGYSVYASDIYDWGYGDNRSLDFLSCTDVPAELNGKQFTVFSNFPFSLAREFVEHSFRLGARKIVVFQRHGWLGSVDRTEFWEKHPYQRCYVSRARISCYWFWLSPHERYSKNSGTTDYCWYVFERGQQSRFHHDWIDYLPEDHRIMPGIAHSHFDIRLEEEIGFKNKKLIHPSQIAAE